MSIYCVACGAQNPDEARFCFKCGRPVGGQGQPTPPPPPPSSGGGGAPAPTRDLVCNSCGAPLKPMAGETVVTCEYCGSSTALSGDGWKAVKTHTMLVPKVFDEKEALEVCRSWMDQGMLHHHLYEDSKLVEGKLSMVPYWIVPASAITHYTYEDMVVEGAKVGGTIAAAALVGGLLGGGGRGGGGLVVAPLFIGGGMGGGSRRAAEISAQYEYPVVAVQGLQSYQPKDYQFDLVSRQPFDKRKIPSGYPLLNGDITEDAATYMAKNYITSVQADKAHKEHRMVQSLSTDVQVQEGELMHAPIWYFTFERKGAKSILLVDGNRMQILNSVH